MKKDSRFTAFAVAVVGVIVFCIGVGLRFYASDMGATAVTGIANVGMSFAKPDGSTGGYQQAMLLANRSNALYDVATVLLWTGGALVILAAVALLFLPYWQMRAMSGVDANVRPDQRAPVI